MKIFKGTNYTDLAREFAFHKAEHEALAVLFLSRIAPHVQFKLTLLKASMHLVDTEPFAVLGFRRSQAFIFVEFYNESEIASIRIDRTLPREDTRMIHRVNITSADDIDRELITWVLHSHRITTPPEDQ